jgi:Flp pilus assembly protein TadG
MMLLSRQRRNRRGMVLMVELLFVLPLLLIVLLAIVQFYILVSAREEMLLASRLGARVAAARAGDAHSDSDRAAAAAEATKTAQVALGHGTLSKADIQVVWSQDETKKDPTATAGEADWVQVVVKVKARQVVPDVLGWVGFTLGSRDIVVANTMMQE